MTNLTNRETTEMRPICPRGAMATWLSNDIDPNTSAGLCEAFRSGAEICLTGAKKLHELSPEFAREVLRGEE
jgi:hypothetical protein